QYVSLKEYQYPKATTLLCALPYPRKMIVLSKYCFCLIIYAVCCLVFGIDTIIFPKLGTFDIKMAAIIFLVITILLSFYFPALYKLGYEKTKFVFVIIIMASPVLFAFLFKPENVVRFNLDTIPTTTTAIFSVIISLVTFSISAILSIQFFEKSDLT
ncbi:MAG: ABC-2 transporter permease, partial [Lachnospiraceae bacterium]|nr:ABC-2 transporter permease [Lachnospiraceae bacterium]